MIRKKENNITRLIPPLFLEKLGLKQADARLEWSRKESNVKLFGVYESSESIISVACIYKCFISIPITEKEARLQVEKRLDERQKVDCLFLPKILSYFLEKRRDGITVIVLTSPLGIQLSRICELGESTKRKEFLSWCLSSLMGIRGLIEEGKMVQGIGAELLYLENGDIKLFDLDDVVMNTDWTMDLKKLVPNSHWREVRVLKPINVPKIFFQTDNFNKFQVFMWGMSFLQLLLGETIIEEVNLQILMNSHPYIVLSAECLKEKLGPQIKIDSVDKIALIFSNCLNKLPGLCTSFNELEDYFAALGKYSYEDLIGSLTKKCGNCGTAFSSQGFPASCNSIMICISCIKNQSCRMCPVPHKFIPPPEEKKPEDALTIQETSTKQKYLVKKAGITIGRNKKNGLCFPSPCISRNHAEIKCQDDYFFIQDKGSSTGTWIGINPTKKLQLGNEIRIGLLGYQVTEIDISVPLLVMNSLHDDSAWEIHSLQETIGTAPDNSIVVTNDQDMAPHQCAFSFVDDGYELRDLGQNGYTLVRLQEKELYFLELDSHFVLGDVHFRVVNKSGTSKIDNNVSFSTFNEEAKIGLKQISKMSSQIMCKICFEKEANSLLLPCSHNILCMSCASQISKCPYCQKEIENILKIFR